MNRLQYFIVDAFTHRPFAGNPAAVVPLETWKPDSWLQAVAMEMNLSETAYLVPSAQGYDLRWFTPKVEVDLCGHATLASAIVLAHLGSLVDQGTISFSTRSGILRAKRSGFQFLLDFPLKAEEPALPPTGLLEALNVSSRYVGRNENDYLVEVDSETVVRSLLPDFKRLAAVNCRAVIVTARSDDPQYDFVSRFFVPSEGIDEDPVTGSAHCCLADYWGKKFNKTKMVGHQVSARGGVVHVAISGERAILGGQGVIVAEGHLLTGGETSGE